jgi:membrane associated rhomboid family serine protease
VKNYLIRQIWSSLFYPFLFVAALWVVFFMQQSSRINFVQFGISPRDPATLTGIITSVFIHGDLDHILSNSLPILVLGMMLFYFYKKIASPVFLWLWIVSGIWLWVGGRNSDDYPVHHIGASTLIYALATFLFFSGVFRRHLRLMVVSALVVFLYGSIMWGIFPLKPEMSWEGHLFGALAGVLIAYNYRREGPQRKIYHWDEDEEEGTGSVNPEAAEEEAESLTEAERNQENFKINYIYKEKPGQDIF